MKFLVTLAFLVAGALGAAAGSVDPLAGLRAEHPRLLATSADWTHLRGRLAQDPLLTAVHTTILGEANLLLEQPPLQRGQAGRRMLGVSRLLVHRLFTLGYAWRMTGDVRFARRAEAEMLAAAGFSDWNPSHFLDTGEAAAAVAVGYDWCHDALTPEARQRIRQALGEKALRPALDPEAPHNYWQTVTNNWNPVCFGGLTLAALAIAEDEPELAREILTRARANIGLGLTSYAPDGVYPEGASYWAYGTTFQVLMIAALESALGTDWNLTAQPGFLASAGVYLQTTAPSGDFYNFFDSWEETLHEPVLYWFARRMADPGLLFFNTRLLQSGALQPDFDRRSRIFPLTALWWPDSSVGNPPPALPLRWSGRGPNPIAVFRESWIDPAALYLALKGGKAGLNHGHMDAGSFVLEADGVRWAVDLGAQDYDSLEAKGIDIWKRGQDSPRWQVYRLNNQSHSTLTIDGHPHRIEGAATLTHFSADDPRAGVIVDLTSVFGGDAARVRRGFRLLPDRRVLVQDELNGLAPTAVVRWQMPTRATVTLDGDRATLRQDGRVLHVQVAAPTGARFAVQPAEAPPDDFNAPNPGVSMLSLTCRPTESAALRFAVVLSPGETMQETPVVIPLDAWKLDPLFP
jgi:hypothetical protein